MKSTTTTTTTTTTVQTLGRVAWLAGCFVGSLVSCTCDEEVDEWERWQEGDVNGDRVTDMLVRSPVGCHYDGCDYLLLEQRPEGTLAQLRVEALTCAIQDTWHLGYADIDCVRLLRTGVPAHPEVRVTERFRKGTGRYIGELEHLDRRGPAGGCTATKATRTTSLFLLPAAEVRVSSETPRGWVQGQPRTPRLGPVLEGALLEIAEQVVEPDGTLWFGVGQTYRLEGWIPASATDCSGGAR